MSSLFLFLLWPLHFLLLAWVRKCKKLRSSLECTACFSSVSFSIYFPLFLYMFVVCAWRSETVGIITIKSVNTTDRHLTTCVSCASKEQEVKSPTQGEKGARIGLMFWVEGLYFWCDFYLLLLLQNLHCPSIFISLLPSPCLSPSLPLQCVEVIAPAEPQAVVALHRVLYLLIWPASPVYHVTLRLCVGKITQAALSF